MKPNKLATFSFIIILIICVTSSYSITYTAIHSFSNQQREGYPDAFKYLSIYQGRLVNGNLRFRILVPSLARILPNPPHWLFSSTRIISDFWLAKVKFGFVNFLFLCATGVLFFYYLTAFGFSDLSSLIGVLFFYTARPVIQFTGTPLADASAYFFMLLCLYALLRQKFLLLFLGFLVGVFSKETLFFIIPAILLSIFDYKTKAKALSLLVPSTLTYFAFRFYIAPDPQEARFILPWFLIVKNQLFFLSHLNRINHLLDLFTAFGFLWVPALYALFFLKPYPLLRRWSWLILIILMVGGDGGRILFLSFPIVIPLVIYWISHILSLSIQEPARET